MTSMKERNKRTKGQLKYLEEIAKKLKKKEIKRSDMTNSK